MDYLIKLRFKNFSNWSISSSKNIKFNVSIGLEVFPIEPEKLDIDSSGNQIELNYFEELAETADLEFIDDNVVRVMNWKIEPGEAVQKDHSFRLKSDCQHEFEFLPQCCFLENDNTKDGTENEYPSSTSMLECTQRNVNQVYEDFGRKLLIVQVLNEDSIPVYHTIAEITILSIETIQHETEIPKIPELKQSDSVSTKMASMTSDTVNNEAVSLQRSQDIDENQRSEKTPSRKSTTVTPASTVRTIKTQVSANFYKPIPVFRPIIQSPYHVAQYTRSETRKTYKVAVYNLEWKSVDRIDENSGNLVRSKVPDLVYLSVRIVKSRNSPRQVLSKTTAKTRLVKKLDSPSDKSAHYFFFFELLTLDVDCLDIEKFTESVLQISIFEHQNSNPLDRFYFDLQDITSEHREQFSSDNHGFSKFPNAVTAESRIAGSFKLFTSIEKPTSMRKTNRTNLTDFERVMLRVEFDNYPEQDENKEYFLAIYLVNDAGKFKKDKHSKSNTLFLISEQICNIGRLGNNNKSIQTPMDLPKIDIDKSFNILAALVVEIIEISKQSMSTSIFGCHMLTPRYYEEDLHPIPLFKNKSGGKTVPGIIGSDDFNSGILNVFMTKLNTEPIIEVKSEELDIKNKDSDYVFGLEPIPIKMVNKSVNANIPDQKALIESQKVKTVIKSRENAKRLLKELTPELTPDQKHLQACLVQVTAKLSEAQHENIQLVEENTELQRRILLSEDLTENVDLSGVQKEDILTRFFAMRSENKNILNELSETRNELNMKQIQMGQEVNNRLNNLHEDYRAKMLHKNKNEKKLHDLIKEQEKLILQLEVEISKLRVKNVEIESENGKLKDNVDLEKRKNVEGGIKNSFTSGYGNSSQLRIISQLKSEADKCRLEAKMKHNEVKHMRHDLSLEVERREAAEGNLERSAARFAGERHRLLVKLRNEQINVTRRMLDYGDDYGNDYGNDRL